jgi:uncharacterized lipoprotein YmbA
MRTAYSVIVCVSLALLAACSSSGDTSPPVTTPVSPTTPTTPAQPTTLAVVKPITDCEKLASVDITDIGGAGSRITSAP